MLASPVFILLSISAVGSIIGFSLVYGGKDAVLWYTDAPSSFPPYGGLVPIVVSWFFSPIFCCIAAATCFTVLKYGLLRQPWGYKGSFFLLPVLIFVTFWLCLYFVFTKGAKKTFVGDDSSWTDNKSLWIAAASAAGVAFLSLLCLPLILRAANKKFAMDDEETPVSIKVQPAKSAWEEGGEEGKAEAPAEKHFKEMTYKEKAMFVWVWCTHGLRVNIHDVSSLNFSL